MNGKEPVILKPGDIFLTRGYGIISSGIRFFTRTVGEKRTKVNHVGLVVEGGTLETAVVIEALNHVVKQKLWDGYGPPNKDDVAVYRAMNLTETDVETIVAAAKRYEGKKYGYLKILAHFADWALLGAYVFRRLAKMDDYPICSWVVAHAYADAGKNFNVDPGAASPDDIFDFVENHPDIYKQIHPLKRLYD